MDPLFTKAQVDMQERIGILPEELIDLITDGTLDAVVYKLEQKFALTEEQGKLLENEIILVLALFFGPETFVENVKESLGVDQAIAEAINAEVREDIFELVADIFETVAKARREMREAVGETNLLKKMEKREDLTKLAETLAQPRTQDQAAPLSVEDIVPIRTMEQDMERVHGYGAYREKLEQEEAEVVSSQDDLLKKDSGSAAS